MSAEERMEEMLLGLGFPPASEPVDLGDWYESAWEQAAYGLLPLQRRNWGLLFDSEGVFHDQGEHSRLVQALLELAGVESMPTVVDRWFDEVGWLLEIEGGGRKESFFLARPEYVHPSDYFEFDLVAEAAGVWLGGGTTVFSAGTPDQIAFLCVLPRAAYEALCEEGLLAPADDWLDSPPMSGVAVVLPDAGAVRRLDAKALRELCEDSATFLPKEPQVDWRKKLLEGQGPCEGCKPVEQAEAVLDAGDVARALQLLDPPVTHVHVYLLGGLSKKPDRSPKKTFVLNVGELRRLIALTRAHAMNGSYEEAEAHGREALRRLNRWEVQQLDDHQRWWQQIVDVLATILGEQNGWEPIEAKIRACELAESIEPAARLA